MIEYLKAFLSLMIVYSLGFYRGRENEREWQDLKQSKSRQKL
jgi:hypothetical protein